MRKKVAKMLNKVTKVARLKNRSRKINPEKQIKRDWNRTPRNLRQKVRERYESVLTPCPVVDKVAE